MRPIPFIVLQQNIGIPVPIAQGGTGQTTAAASFDALAPTTTRGDLIARGASSNIRLPIGATANLPLISNGTDPVYATPGAVAGAVFDALGPTTTRGDLIARGAAGNQRLALGTGLQVPTSNGTDPVWATPQVPMAAGMINGTLFESHAANAATFAIKTLAGADPTPGDPVIFVIPNTTGGYTVKTITAAFSLTLGNGSTVGVASATRFTLYISVFDDAGTPRLGLNQGTYASGTNRGLFGFTTPFIFGTLAEGGGTATLGGVWYTNVAVSSKPFIILGSAEYQSGLATAGQWSVSPNVLALWRPGDPLPGSCGSVYFRDTTGKINIKGLLNTGVNIVDQNGTLNIDTLAANWVPIYAKSVLLTVEAGYSTNPAAPGGVCAIRVMPDGYNLGSLLDFMQIQQVSVTVVGSTGVVATSIQIPISPARRQFFYAMQSTDAATANKTIIIDMEGYTV